jgi:hypothetical protein
MQDDMYYLCPSSMYKSLALGSNGWGLRMAGIESIPQNMRCSQFQPTSESQTTLGYTRPLSIERALSRMQQDNTEFAIIYNELVGSATNCEYYEDIIDLEEKCMSALYSDVRVRMLSSGTDWAVRELADIINCIKKEKDVKKEKDLIRKIDIRAEQMDEAPLEREAFYGVSSYCKAAAFIRGQILSVARCCYGKFAEPKCIREWNDINTPEDQICTSSDLITAQWFDLVGLRGRLDGRFSGSGQVVEMKFRTGMFPLRGPSSQEKLQLQAYMFITGTNACTLIEGVCKRKSLIMRHSTVLFDPQDWEAVTEHARRLLHFRREIASHSLFRSSYFALSMENQVRMIESAVIVDEHVKLKLADDRMNTRKRKLK